MSIEQGPSPEQVLAERIKSALIDHYNKAIEVPEEEQGKYANVFHGFDKPEAVKAILEQQGIDVSTLEIEAKGDLKGYDYQDGRHGGDAYPGATVKISSGGKILFEHFFESPDDKYEY